MSLYIIYGNPGVGKTSLLTKFAVDYMFDYARNRTMQRLVLNLNQNGFNLTVPEHCVFSNYYIKGKKYRASSRVSYSINPYRMGFANKDVKTHFLPPCFAAFIQEAQEVYNSRKSKDFPDWISRFVEQQRHWFIDIYLDLQRPMLADKNLRDIAIFIQVRSLRIFDDEYGKPCKLVWTVREIPNARAFEKYNSSGETDYSCFREYKITADYNVFDCYVSRNKFASFIKGHFEEDFTLVKATVPEQTKEGFLTYLAESDDEMPVNFYK